MAKKDETFTADELLGELRANAGRSGVGVDRMVDAHESLYRSLLGSEASTALTQ